jgi:hypothetical protein
MDFLDAAEIVVERRAVQFRMLDDQQGQQCGGDKAHEE